MRKFIIILLLITSSASYADCKQTDEEIFTVISEAVFLQKEAVVGLRCLIDMPNAENILLRLSNSKNKLAWLYAAIGLREIDSNEYVDVLSKIKEEGMSFTYSGSDNIRDTTISKEALVIEQGNYEFYR